MFLKQFAFLCFWEWCRCSGLGSLLAVIDSDKELLSAMLTSSGHQGPLVLRRSCKRNCPVV